MTLIDYFLVASLWGLFFGLVFGDPYIAVFGGMFWIVAGPVYVAALVIGAVIDLANWFRRRIP